MRIFPFLNPFLEYLAAGIAGNHDVRFLDMRLDPGLDSLLGEYQPDVVGITSPSLFRAYGDFMRRLDTLEQDYSANFGKS